MTGRIRGSARLRVRCLATFTVAGCLALSLAVSSGTAKSNGKHDPDDAAGPLDIRQVHLGQSGPKLGMRIETFGPWKARDLIGDPGVDPAVAQSYLCIELVQQGRRSRNCLTASKQGRERLTHMKVEAGGSTRGSDSIDAGVRRGGRRSARISFRFEDADLKPGHIGWRVISGSDDTACAVTASAAGEEKPDAKAPDDAEPPPPPPPPPPTPTGACDDQLPDGGGTMRFKVRQPRIVGCTHGGPLIRSRGRTKGKQVALTFDDGPSSYTAGVLKALDDRDVKGTFFVVGQEAGGRGGVLRAAVEHGHEVANHTMHHDMLPSSTDMRATSGVIRRATGFTPCSFRPPGGAINLSVAHGARSLGMTTVLWDVDTRDWTGIDSGTIRSRATSVRSGSIVLMHDGGGNRGPTAAAVPGIISTLKGRGYELVTVSRLLGEHPIWKP